MYHLSISVVIPTYNRASTLLRSIDSVREQTVPVNEIIIVDDGSTDNTEQLVNSIADSRIKYVKQSNQGQNHARNVGVEHAESFWVAFHDSDDIWYPNKIKKITEKIKEISNNSKIDLGQVALFHAFRRESEPGSDKPASYPVMPTALLAKYPDGVDATQSNFDQMSILLGNFMSSQTIILPRSAHKILGGFDTTLKRYTDWDMAIRIADSMKMIFLSEPLAVQYVQVESASTDVKQGDIARRQIFKKYRHLYRQRPYIYLRQKLRIHYRALRQI